MRLLPTRARGGSDRKASHESPSVEGGGATAWAETYHPPGLKEAAANSSPGRTRDARGAHSPAGRTHVPEREVQREPRPARSGHGLQGLEGRSGQIRPPGTHTQSTGSLGVKPTLQKETEMRGQGSQQHRWAPDSSRTETPLLRALGTRSGHHVVGRGGGWGRGR